MVAIDPVNRDPADWGFLVSEATGRKSREQFVVKGPIAAKIKAGTVMGKITGASADAAVATAVAGNTGNGAMPAVTVGAGAIEGEYNLIITAAAGNAGSFKVEDPNGQEIGQGTVAVAFNKGGLSFTLPDGATDWAVNDRVKITVAPGASANAGKYAPYNPAAVDGTEKIAMILGPTLWPSTADQRTGGINTEAEVRGDSLIWPVGFTSDQIKAGEAALAADLGIKVRY